MKNHFLSVLIITACIITYSCKSNTQEINLDANRDIVKKYHNVWSNGQKVFSIQSYPQSLFAIL